MGTEPVHTSVHPPTPTTHRCECREWKQQVRKMKVVEGSSSAWQNRRHTRDQTRWYKNMEAERKVKCESERSSQRNQFCSTRLGLCEKE